MAATEALSLIHERYQVTADGHKPLTMVYKRADVSQNAFTKPIDLRGAKSVWVHVESLADAEFYIPSLAGEDPANSTTYENNFDINDDNNYMKISASFASSNIGLGMGVVVPSDKGAGCISGDLMPPYLSVKLTGADDKDITIIVNY